MPKLTVYLAGPIMGCDDEECKAWRLRAKQLLTEAGHDVLDPMSRDYRGQEADKMKEVVEGDKGDIDFCNAVLAFAYRPSVGTSMEIFYAWSKRKIVVTVAIDPSPWLIYHSTFVVPTLTDAISLIVKAGEHNP